MKPSSISVVSAKPESKPKSVWSKYLPVVLGHIGGFLLKLLAWSYRKKVLLVPMKPELQVPLSKPLIVVFWHGQQLMWGQLYPSLCDHIGKRNLYSLISEHGDGRIIATAVRSFGIHSVAGSSSRGGRRAMLEMVSLLRDKESHCAITPDGPKGPIFKVKPGTIKLAQLTGAPLLLMGAASKKYWQFGSWDKMRLPKPFTKVIGLLSEPIFVPRDISEAEFNELSEKIERELCSITERAHELAQR